jgi:hypothetical protein
MKKIIVPVIAFLLINAVLFAQTYPELKFSESGLNINNEIFQPKKTKKMNAYFGAGYSFVIFTDGLLSSPYPVIDTRTGNFLSEINLFFGFSIAKAVTIEAEPSFLFTNSSKVLRTELSQPHNTGGNDTFVVSSNIGMFAIPLAVNVRFFPFFKQEKSFIRMFFIGGGAGMIWVKEDYDNFYTPDPYYYGNYYYGYGGITESTSQWAPIFRVMIGLTGAGGQFGGGGELRYNFIPLKSVKDSPFATRQAKNMNSVDLTLRFYFSL